MATGARLVVSRGKDLLALGEGSAPEARALSERFPWLRVLTPVQLLAELDEG